MPEGPGERLIWVRGHRRAPRPGSLPDPELLERGAERQMTSGVTDQALEGWHRNVCCGRPQCARRVVSMRSQSYRNAALLATLLLSSWGITTRGQAQTQSPRNPATARAPKNPGTAPQVSVDRFSAKAGKLQVRTATNGLPAPNQPVNFDRGPFITQGLGPDGTPVRYYNCDVQSTTPAPIYALFREGENQPVEGQLNIVAVIPGRNGYNDFWQVVKVTVPHDYVANTVTSLAEIREAGYRMEATPMLVNCPIVPHGSVARMRLNGGSAELHRGWYRGQVVSYFTFEEHALRVAPSGE